MVIKKNLKLGGTIKIIFYPGLSFNYILNSRWCFKNFLKLGGTVKIIFYPGLGFKNIFFLNSRWLYKDIIFILG
jgi:hypothetical protein